MRNLAVVLTTAVLTLSAMSATSVATEKPRETTAAEQQYDPRSIDLVKMIECGYEVDDYVNLAFSLNAQTEKLLGWTEVNQANPFLKEYALSKPITAFDSTTQRIVFTNAGVMAVLDDVTPQALAKRLGLETVIDTPKKAMFFKVIKTTSEEVKELGMVMTKKITLNVSNVDSHPGKTLAGCTYRFDLK